MKKFLIHICFMLLAVIILMGIFDFVYTYTYSTSIPRNKFQYILKMKPQKIDYVFLGSSRTANHIVTPEVTKITGKSAINLGMEGAVFGDNLLELQLLISNKIKMQKVFMQVDYMYNYEGLSNIGNAAVLPFVYNPIVKKHLEAQLPNYGAICSVPFYRYMTADYAIGFREFFFSAIRKKSKFNMESGFTPKAGHENLNPIELPATLSKDNKILEEITAICKDNNIELVLFCAPFCSNTVNLDYIQKLKQRIPGLHDYSTAMKDDQFFNCGHMNEDGAVVFTKMFMNDCCK